MSLARILPSTFQEAYLSVLESLGVLRDVHNAQVQAPKPLPTVLVEARDVSNQPGEDSQLRLVSIPHVVNLGAQGSRTERLSGGDSVQGNTLDKEEFSQGREISRRKEIVEDEAIQQHNGLKLDMVTVERDQLQMEKDALQSQINAMLSTSKRGRRSCGHCRSIYDNHSVRNVEVLVAPLKTCKEGAVEVIRSLPTTQTSDLGGQNSTDEDSRWDTASERARKGRKRVSRTSDIPTMPTLEDVVALPLAFADTGPGEASLKRRRGPDVGEALEGDRRKNKRLSDVEDELLEWHDVILKTSEPPSSSRREEVLKHCGRDPEDIGRSPAASSWEGSPRRIFEVTQHRRSAEASREGFLLNRHESRELQEKENHERSGPNEHKDFDCGVTSKTGADTLGIVRVNRSGKIQLFCRCDVDGCSRDTPMTPGAFEKHGGRAASKKWRDTIWIVQNNYRLPISRVKEVDVYQHRPRRKRESKKTCLIQSV